MASKNKGSGVKSIIDRNIWSAAGPWCVHYGEIKRKQGRPSKVENLFLAIAEKIPFDALARVQSDLKSRGIPARGVYIAHDSMGFPRYVGRGNIFTRLYTRRRVNREELRYFSFYVVKDRKHEREIETLVIRAAGPLLEFNERKKTWLVSAGRMTDYERGTKFYERQSKKGRTKKS